MGVDHSKHLYNKARIGHWELDWDTDILVMDDIARDIFHLPDKKTLSRDERQDFYYSDEDREYVLKLMKDAVSTNGSFDVEIRLKTRENYPVWYIWPARWSILRTTKKKF